MIALLDTDFDLTAGTVSITKMFDEGTIQPPKSRQGVRTLALPAFALDAVRRHLAGREPGPAFTIEGGGYIHRSNFVRRDWAGLLKAAGVKYRKFHTFRHTLASRLLMAGVDVAEVARVLGDRIETVTRTYAHWMHSPKRDTAAKIEAIYGTDPAG